MTRRSTAVLITAVLAATMMAFTPMAAAEGDGPVALTVAIDAPDDGDFVEPSDGIIVEGTVTIDGGGSPDTSIIYVLDRSGSMRRSAAVDCDGDGQVDSRAVCQAAAVRSINEMAAAPDSSILNAGVISFAGRARIDLGLTPDLGAVEEVLLPRPGGATNYGRAVRAVRRALRDPATAPRRIVLFFSDGASTRGGLPRRGFPAGTEVQTFAIGADARCHIAGTANDLQGVADLGDTGSCTEVADLSDLPDVIDEVLGTQLTRIELEATVEGVSVDLDDVDIDPPVSGGVAGATVPFSATLPTDLPTGVAEICAAAVGTDGGHPVQSERSCVEVEIVETTVDCSVDPDCTLTFDDGGTTEAVAQGIGGFDKNLAARVLPLDECPIGDGECITGYEVLFPELGESGAIVELTVTASSRETSTHPGEAAVFLDGERISNQCRVDEDDDDEDEDDGREDERDEDEDERDDDERDDDEDRHPGDGIEILPCVDIRRVDGGLTQYFVRVDADPKFYFR